MNKCKDVKLVIKELDVEVGEEDPYYFAWDEPCRKAKLLKAMIESTDKI